MTPEDISLSSSYLTHCAKIGPFSDFFASQLPHVFHCRGVDMFLLTCARAQVLHYSHLVQVSRTNDDATKSHEQLSRGFKDYY